MPPVPVLLMVRELGIGGCERDLTKIAKALDRSRYEPHVGCFHPEGLRTEELRAAGVPILHLPVTSFRSFSTVAGAVQMARYIRRHDIGLVHAFDTPLDLFAVPIARALRVPVIANNLWYRDLAPPLHLHGLRITGLLADAIVVNSVAVRRHLVTDEKVPASRIYLCYNGVETEVFHPRCRARLSPVQDASLVIGVVCALRPEKRLDLLLPAFARIRHLRPGLKLLIVGSGPTLPALREICAGLGLEQHCHFEPATKDVPRWMRSIDVLVQPSWSESFPNAVLEGMACGCCVVASRVGGIPELVSSGKDGLLFERGDVEALAGALAALVNDDGLRASLAAAAVRTAHEKFSIEIAARRTEAIYGALL